MPETNEPVFLTREMVDKIHESGIVAYGGLRGVLNEHLLESQSANLVTPTITAAATCSTLPPLMNFTSLRATRIAFVSSGLASDRHLYFLNGMGSTQAVYQRSQLTSVSSRLRIIRWIVRHWRHSCGTGWIVENRRGTRRKELPDPMFEQVLAL